MVLALTLSLAEEEAVRLSELKDVAAMLPELEALKDCDVVGVLSVDAVGDAVVESDADALLDALGVGVGEPALLAVGNAVPLAVPDGEMLALALGVEDCDAEMVAEPLGDALAAGELLGVVAAEWEQERVCVGARDALDAGL